MGEHGGPSWDLSTEYKGVDDTKWQTLRSRLDRLLLEIRKEVVPFAAWLSDPAHESAHEGAQDPLVTAGVGGVAKVASLLKKRDEAKTILHDMITFCSCLLSVDGTLEAPKKGLGECDALDADLNVALKPLLLWFTLASEAAIQCLRDHPDTRSESFAIEKLRKRRDQALSLDQESLIEQLEIHGPLAFGRLYEDLTGTLSCQVETGKGDKQTIGLAEAANWLMGSDEALRRRTYEAVDKTFRGHESSFSAIINHITGWRQSVLKARSFKKPQHYLDPALHQAHISQKTLMAMMEAVEGARPLGQKALQLQAGLLNKKVLDPWDLMAPCPSFGKGDDHQIGFAEGIRKIEASFGQLSPSMKEFVTMMVDKRWIDGSVGPTKRPGAFCTQFLGSREPRVYMTYSGSLTNLSTLAHELGHAMHFWLMRDLPLIELDYPMTLAETASIFAESLLYDDLVQSFQDRPQELLSLLWEGAGDAATFLLNIPARFTMESQFHEHRQKSLLTPDDLRHITDQAWRHWYGTSLSQPNVMFWATKLHFSIGSMSFYNFPYTFGYLFSLSVFSRRAEFGKDFFNRYRALLRDTGRMTAEQVAQKHLGEDISEPKFWLNALEIVKARVDQFEKAVLKLS